MKKIFNKKLLLDKELEEAVGGGGYPFDVFPPNSTQDIVCVQTGACTGVQLCGADVTVNVGNCDAATNGACFNTQQC